METTSEKKRTDEDAIKKRQMKIEVFFKLTQKVVQKYSRLIRKSAPKDGDREESGPETTQQTQDGNGDLLETLKEGFEVMTMLVKETEKKLERSKLVAPRALRAHVRSFIKDHQSWLKFDSEDLGNSDTCPSVSDPSPLTLKNDETSSLSSSSSSSSSPLPSESPRKQPLASPRDSPRVLKAKKTSSEEERPQQPQQQEEEEDKKSTSSSSSSSTSTPKEAKRKTSHLRSTPGHAASEGVPLPHKPTKISKQSRNIEISSPTLVYSSKDKDKDQPMPSFAFPHLMVHSNSAPDTCSFSHDPPSVVAPPVPPEPSSVASIIPEIFDLVPKQISYFQSFQLPDLRVMKPPRIVEADSHSEEEVMQARREMVLDELITTEIAYTRSLGALISYYVKPLQSDCPFAPDRLVRNTFVNIEEVFEFTRGLLDDLLLFESVTGPDQPVGELFFKREKQFLSIYSTFCSLKNSSEKALSELKQDQKTAAFLTHASSLDHSASIDSLLIQPFQRIVRYKLLLEQLLKFTDKTWPDFLNLQKAIDVLQHILLETNQRTGKNDNMSRIKQICSKINGFVS